MIIYHGSKSIVKEPQFKGLNPNNDYGPAFYTTLDLEAAKVWACKNDEIGLINKYSVNNSVFKNLKVLDLTDKSKYSVLNWVAIIMHFRNLSTKIKTEYKYYLDWLDRYYINVDDYDVVIGYRADDSYFKFPLSFVKDELAFDDLETVYLKGDLDKQYAFVSKRAVKSLKFLGIIGCEPTFIGRYFAIVSRAEEEVNAILREEKTPNKTYILDLVRKDNG